MDDKHRKAIQSQYKSLVARTDLDEVVNVLFNKGVFSEHMIEKYRDESKLPEQRKRQLYIDVTLRGPEAFNHLVNTLYELGHKDIASALDPDNPFSFKPVKRVQKPKPTDNYISLSKRPGNVTSNEMQRNIPNASHHVMPPPPQVAEPEESPTNYEVIKSTTFMDDASANGVYRTRGRNRGVLVVFSYTSFDNNIDNPRAGVDVDCEKLKNLFDEIGFDVLSYNNLALKQTLDTLQSMEDVLKDTESVFIVFSSHGYQRVGTSDNDIRCSDGSLIAVSDIMNHFSNRQLPKLIGIPKVFIFQICRGNNKDYVWHTPDMSELQTDGRPEPPTGAASSRLLAPQPPFPTEFPLFSDILIAHSTLPGHVSYRHETRGSWYIQMLCEVFAAHAYNTHVDDLFTLVDIGMQKKHRLQTSSVDRWGFNKRLYLHPGLFE